MFVRKKRMNEGVLCFYYLISGNIRIWFWSLTDRDLTIIGDKNITVNCIITVITL